MPWRHGMKREEPNLSSLFPWVHKDQQTIKVNVLHTLYIKLPFKRENNKENQRWMIIQKMHRDASKWRITWDWLFYGERRKELCSTWFPLCLLHFKVTKVGNWLGAGKSSTKTCWKRTNGFQNHWILIQHFPPSFAIHCVLERFSFVDVVKVLVCILQYTVGGLYLQSSRMYWPENTVVLQYRKCKDFH